jgi:S1-C subfamily serine protease
MRATTSVVSADLPPLDARARTEELPPLGPRPERGPGLPPLSPAAPASPLPPLGGSAAPPRAPAPPAAPGRPRGPHGPRGTGRLVALGVALLAAGAVGGVSAGLITGGDSPPAATGVATTSSTPQSSITSFVQDDLSNAVARVAPTVVQVQTDAGSQGSGVILEPSGLIVTNQHVVRGATSVTILTADEHRVAADIVKADDRQDLAILRPQTPVGHGAELATEPDGGLRLGEKVFAIGSPFGLQGTVTAGVVSTIGRTNAQGIPMIQIDAPINPGNSGGGLFDLRGRLVGIPSSILAPIPGNVGIGFAIPASRVAAMVSNIP